MATAKKTEGPQTLHAALLEAQLEVEQVAKDARNKHHGYNYASAESMIAYGRELLNRHGLVLVVQGHKYRSLGLEETTTDRDGVVTVSPLLAVEVALQLIHPASGDSRSWTSELMVIQSKGRPWDKGTLASETEILGYTIRDILQIDRGEGEGVSGRDDSQYEPRKQKRATRTKADASKLDGLRDRVKELYRQLQELGPMEWREVCSAATGDHRTPKSAQGLVKVKDYLKQEIKRLEEDQMPEWGGGPPDEDPNNGEETAGQADPGAP